MGGSSRPTQPTLWASSAPEILARLGVRSTNDDMLSGQPCGHDHVQRSGNEPERAEPDGHGRRVPGQVAHQHLGRRGRAAPPRGCRPSPARALNTR